MPGQARITKKSGYPTDVLPLVRSWVDERLSVPQKTTERTNNGFGNSRAPTGFGVPAIGPMFFSSEQPIFSLPVAERDISERKRGGVKNGPLSISDFHRRKRNDRAISNNLRTSKRLHTPYTRFCTGRRAGLLQPCVVTRVPDYSVHIIYAQARAPTPTICRREATVSKNELEIDISLPPCDVRGR